MRLAWRAWYGIKNKDVTTLQLVTRLLTSAAFPGVRNRLTMFISQNVICLRLHRDKYINIIPSTSQS